MHWLLIYYVAYFIEGSFTKNIYVSQTSTSNDTTSCGSIENPCKTLNFVMSSISHNADTILLDGGPLQGPVFFYQVHDVMKLEQNLTITKVPSLSHDPIITGNSSSPITYVFEIDYKGVLYLNVTYITFEGVSIVSVIGPTFATVDVYECKCRNSRSNQLQMVTNGDGIGIANVRILKSVFYNNIAVIKTRNVNKLSLVMKDCIIEGNNTFGLLIYAEAKNMLHISVEKTTFFCLHSAITIESAITCPIDEQVINIDTCNFYNNFPREILQKHPRKFDYFGSPLSIYGCLVTRILNSNFSGNIAKSGGALSLYRVYSALLKNCSFANNTANSYGGAFYLRNSTLPTILLNCTFLKNTANDSCPYNFFTKYGYFIEVDQGKGGAIASYSDVIVNKTYFYDNTASIFGGTIYHKYTFNSAYDKHIGTVQYKKTTRFSLYSSIITGVKGRHSLYGDLIYAESNIDLEDVYLKALTSTNQNSYIYHADDSILKIKGSFQFSCPLNHQLSSKINRISVLRAEFGLFIFYCFTCKKDSFSLHHESYFMKRHSNYLVKNKIKCMPCPTGGKCDANIISNDNFWGSYYNDSMIFIACPYQYCCTNYGEKCTTYNTCAHNRNGILCGSCKQGYSENFISPECVPHETCHSNLFWLFYFLAAVLYVLVIMYLKELVFIFKQCSKRFKATSVDVLRVRLLTETNGDCGGIEDESTSDGLHARLLTETNRDSGRIEDESTVDDLRVRLLTETNRNSDQTDNEATGDDLQVRLLTETIRDSETKRDNSREHIPESTNSIKEFTLIANSLETTSYIQTQSHVSGILKILFFFYQMEFLIKVAASARNSYDLHDGFMKDIVRSLFNLQMSSDESGFKICPYQGIDAIGKEVVKVCFSVVLFLIIFLLIISSYVNKLVSRSTEESRSNETVLVIDDHVPILCKVPFHTRLKASTLQLLLLTYASIATFSFKMLNCVQINETKHLYLNGNTICWQWWQFLVISFIAIWVISFPLGLYIGNRMLRYCKITVNQFIVGLFVPLWLIASYAYKKPVTTTLTEAIHAKHILSITDDAFRRKSNGVGNVMWEGMLIFRRLILIVLIIFIIDPITRLYVVLVPLFAFLIDHIRVRPYKDNILNWLEIISLIFLSFLCVLNIFWAYLYISDVIMTPSLKLAGYVFLLIEFSILLLPLGVLVLGIIYILGKFFVKLYKGFSLKQD